MHDMTVQYTSVRWWYQNPIPDTTIFVVVSGVIKLIKKKKNKKNKKKKNYAVSMKKKNVQEIEHIL